jgi:transposase
VSRYRLQPTAAQEAALLEHCAHARFVWNLAVEQHSWWSRQRGPAPRFAEQCRQLTAARAEHEWLRGGSVTVQQQALRDFAAAMALFYEGSHRLPKWRKAGRDEGFRVVGQRGTGVGTHWDVRRLSRNVGQVKVPKIGWISFRWSRPVPDGVKSYRVTRDRAGRWHVAFATIPEPIPGPGNGAEVGVDRGVVAAVALSTGELSTVPTLRPAERRRLLSLRRKLVRAKRGSTRRSRTKLAISRLRTRETDRRKDWVEKTTTDLARRFDLIAVEDLKIASMTRSARGTVEAPGRNIRQKTGLNKAILSAGWGLLVERLEGKAPGRIAKVKPAFTSLTCNACGHCAAENRESQAVFRCLACGHVANADVNAACNIRDIAAGRAVTARGGSPLGEPVNREPQPELLAA